MTTLRWLLVVGLAGCDNTMDVQMDRMQSLIDEGRSESDAHVAAIAEAGDADSIQAEMARHAGEMTPMMGALDEAADRIIEYCVGGTAGMRANHGALDGEVAHHAAVMALETDPASARIEVERHASAIEMVFDGMEEAMSEMSCGD